MKKSPRVLVSACEPSGDRAAARVATALQRRGVSDLYGAGGPMMRAACVDMLQNIDDLAAMGLLDPARRLLQWGRVWATLREEAQKRPPDAALLVDAPDFHLPLARALKASGIPVILYVGPQVWAWRRNRLSLIKERADLVALILPFEKPFYDEAGVSARFVGHPILDEAPPAHRLLVRHALGISPDVPLIAMLPGSRPGEIERHLGPMVDAAYRLQNRGIASRISPGGPKKTFNIDPSLLLTDPFSARDLLAASDAAIIASGTAVLEAAVLGVPSAAVYRTDPISYAAGRYLLSLPYLSLPNWIVGKKVVPELLQTKVTGKALCDTALSLLSPSIAALQKRVFSKIVASLGGPGVADRVAAAVLEYIP